MYGLCEITRYAESESEGDGGAMDGRNGWPREWNQAYDDDDVLYVGVMCYFAI